jgi:hypothetical protein
MLTGTNIVPISNIRVATMLVLLATRNKKLQQWSSMMITPNLKKTYKQA